MRSRVAAARRVAPGLRREERRRDVALAGVGQDRDDPLPARLGPLGDARAPPTSPRRRRSRRARPRGARAGARSRSRPRRRPAITSSSSSRLSTAGTKPAPIPWILCGPGVPPDSTADAAGSTATTRQSRVALLQHLADAGDRAAGADAGDEHVDAGRPVASQISGPVVRRWISGLAGFENWSGRKTSSLLGHRARGGDRLVHPAQRLGDLDARAVEPQQPLALAAHPLRERQHELVALRRADERERDARCCRSSPRRSSCARARCGPRARPPRSSRRRCGP